MDIEVIILLSVALFSLMLLIVAMFILFTISQERLTLPRWAWFLICLISIIGPTVFLVFGRKKLIVEEISAIAQDSRSVLVNKLYKDGE